MDVRTLEIPQDDWVAFLARVDRAFHERKVSVEIDGPELGAQVLATGAKLQGIAMNPKGTQEIELDFGELGEAEHRVIQPSHVYAIENSAGELAWLDIEDTEGDKTLVRFEEPPIIPARK